MNTIHTRIPLEQFSTLVKDHGKVMEGDDAVEKAYNAILLGIRGLAFGGDERVILDCRGVNLITPGILLAIATRLEYKETPHRRFCDHRSLIVMDPNEDTALLLKWMLKGIQCSLLMVYTDGRKYGKVVREEILNLPRFLRETLDILAKYRVLGSRQLIEILNGKNPTAVREALRQLFKRGLVKRQAEGTVDGKRFFLYEPFTLVGFDWRY